MKRRLLLVAGLLVVLAVAAAGVVAHHLWSRLHSPFQDYPGDERVVHIVAGTSGVGILEQLQEEGVLEHAELARLYLVHVLGDPSLKAGEYRFSGPASAPEVLDKLIRGEVLTHRVTLVEGLTLVETAAELAAQGFGDEQAFLAAMNSPAAIADLDPAATNLEGYLFPDTYVFARSTSEEEIVRRLVSTFRRHWQDELAGRLAGLREKEVKLERRLPEPFGVRELVVLASLVEKEAKLADERPVIAAVYANRLRQGIGLYADPTVIYALKRLGRWDGNIRKGDLKLDSPYNTYRYQGLPPGPIASPGLESLRAAADPADVPYLYFVSRNDGSHIFASTLAEHNRNVNLWQKQYWRKKWAREGR